MKWIIDIPEKVVTAIQNGEDYRYDIHTAIAQGIPYEEKPKYFPPCEDCNKKMEEIRQAYDKMKAMERPHDKWIPVTYRPLTTEERIAFAEHYGIEYCDTVDEKAFDCPMPEDGQEILISTSWGVVEDCADNDVDGEGFICYGLEVNGDWDGIDAWMPKPEPYKKEGEEE